jgi:hypothetical protein
MKGRKFLWKSEMQPCYALSTEQTKHLTEASTAIRKELLGNAVEILINIFKQHFSAAKGHHQVTITKITREN